MTNKKVKVYDHSFFWSIETTRTLTIDDDGFGVLDEEAVYAFTHGQCHALAIALNKLTGWMIKGIGDEEDPKDSPAHCLVYSPTLRAYVDIKGQHKKVPALRHCGRMKVLNRNISPDYARKYLQGYLRPNVQAALPFARALLQQLGV